MCRWEACVGWPHVSWGSGVVHAVSAEPEFSLPGGCHAACVPAPAKLQAFSEAPCPLLQSLGDVFSSLSAAVGAADKVVEMIKRVAQIPAAWLAVRPATFVGGWSCRTLVVPHCLHCLAVCTC